MRLVIQRVLAASVSTAERGVVGSIGKGLCVLVGFTAGDGERQLEWAINHLLNGKYWPNEAGSQWKSSVEENSYELLLVSQFTLYAQVYKKNRLDFHHALGSADARALYDRLLASASERIGSRAQGGEFGAYMEVAITNDGPVTTILDSRDM